MLAHIEAIKALLATAHPAYFVTVPPPAPPAYYLVWAPPGTPGVDLPLSDDRADINTLIGVTGTSATPEGALAVLEAARTILTPTGGADELTVAGWRSWLRLVDSRVVQIDPDATIPNTSLHPAFGVDMYRLIATPA